MPFYEYECPSCRYYAEVMQKISDVPLKKCPSCGKAGFKRLISAPVFRLKGSGWYETDFKSDKEGKRNLAGPDREDSKPADDASKGTAAAKADKPADSKPADSKPAPAEGAGKASGGSSRRAPAKAPVRSPAKSTAARPRTTARKAAGAGRKRK